MEIVISLSGCVLPNRARKSAGHEDAAYLRWISHAPQAAASRRGTSTTLMSLTQKHDAQRNALDSKFLILCGFVKIKHVQY